MKTIGKLKLYSSHEIEKSNVSIGFECLDRELFNPERCYDWLGKSGVKYARCQTGWNRCEMEKGVYTFEWLDSVIDNLLARGVQPWLSVTFGNRLYMPDVPEWNKTCVGCVPLYYGEEALNAWKNFVREIAKRYRGRVSQFEIWNEPDIKPFWYPEEPDGEKYAELVRITGGIIREEIPDAKIGAVVANPRNFHFIRRLFAALKPEEVHFFCYHRYTRYPEHGHASLMKYLHSMLEELGMQHVEVWQGEGGYPSWAYKGHWLVAEGCDDERGQAVYLLRRYFQDMSCGAVMSSFFQMVDLWEKPYSKANEVLQKPAGHGILHGIEYTPKESYRTISHMAAVFSGDVKPTQDYIAINAEGADTTEWLSIQAMSFTRNGKPFYAYYIPSDLSKAVSFSYKASAEVSAPLQNPVLIDTYTGDVYEPESRVDAHGMTHLENLPITDYPLIIADRDTFAIVE